MRLDERFSISVVCLAKRAFRGKASRQGCRHSECIAKHGKVAELQQRLSPCAVRARTFAARLPLRRFLTDMNQGKQVNHKWRQGAHPSRAGLRAHSGKRSVEHDVCGCHGLLGKQEPGPRAWVDVCVLALKWVAGEPGLAHFLRLALKL